MLRRFSNRREAVPESIAAKTLGRAKPMHRMNAAPPSGGQAGWFVSNPAGKPAKGAKRASWELQRENRRLLAQAVNCCRAHSGIRRWKELGAAKSITDLP